MRIHRVTITGADESIRPEELLPLADEFPCVEWGILRCRSLEGTPRFPSRAWLDELRRVHDGTGLALAAHLCGADCRRLVHDPQGGPAAPFSGEDLGIFRRVQLNFSPYSHTLGSQFIGHLLGPPQMQWIFQVGRRLPEALIEAGLRAGVDLACLFDRSGGRGHAPAEWPAPILGVPCGYAGGLGPQTLLAELARIESVAGESTIWIDMESGVRSSDNQRFDLARVHACLALAQGWVG